MWRASPRKNSEWRQTDRYTDPQSIPLFGEMEKLATILPPLGAPLKSGKIGQNGANVVQADFSPANKKIAFFRGERPVLAKAAPSWDSPDLVPEGTRISSRDLQPVASEKTCGIGKPGPSSIASPDAERLCRELAELVAAWPKLRPEIRLAILTLLRAAKIG